MLSLSENIKLILPHTPMNLCIQGDCLYVWRLVDLGRMSMIMDSICLFQETTGNQDAESVRVADFCGRFSLFRSRSLINCDIYGKLLKFSTGKFHPWIYHNNNNNNNFFQFFFLQPRNSQPSVLSFFFFSVCLGAIVCAHEWYSGTVWGIKLDQLNAKQSTFTSVLSLQPCSFYLLLPNMFLGCTAISDMISQGNQF